MRLKLFLFLLSISIKLNYSQINSDSLCLKLLEITKAKEVYENVISLMMTKNNFLNQKNSDIFRNFFWQNFCFDSVKNDLVNIYSEEFTPGELQYLIDFYSTPLGKKVINSTPIIFAKIQRMADEKYRQKLPILDSLLFVAYLQDTATMFNSDLGEKIYLHDKDLDTATIEESDDYEECSKFHEGKFVMKDSLMDIYFIRDKNSQHEISETLNSDAEFKIEWINDCEYNLIFVKNKNNKLAFYIKPGDIANVKITAVRDNEYDCVTSFKNFKNKVTLVRVE